jgi:ribosomal protein S18 acetylase RimI-like enzyme
MGALGVLRHHRRKGLGRALLLEGMRALRRRGCTHLTLGVDSENLTGALRLYESVGFREWRTGVTFRKVLRGEGVTGAASPQAAADRAADRAPR